VCVRVCVCVCRCLCVCVRVCVCVCVCVWTTECLLMASAVLEDRRRPGAVCLHTKGITFHYIKQQNHPFNRSPLSQHECHWEAELRLTPLLEIHTPWPSRANQHRKKPRLHATFHVVLRTEARLKGSRLWVSCSLPCSVPEWLSSDGFTHTLMCPCQQTLLFSSSGSGGGLVGAPQGRIFELQLFVPPRFAVTSTFCTRHCVLIMQPYYTRLNSSRHSLLYFNYETVS